MPNVKLKYGLHGAYIIGLSSSNFKLAVDPPISLARSAKFHSSSRETMQRLH